MGNRESRERVMKDLAYIAARDSANDFIRVTVGLQGVSVGIAW
jgi:hypothetical protein